MKLVVLAGEEQKEEFLSVSPGNDCEIIWFSVIPGEGTLQADLLVDLHPDFSAERNRWIQQQSFSCVMVAYPPGSVKLPDGFIRINAWPGFTGRVFLEACSPDASARDTAEVLAGKIGRSIEWTDESTGFASQRIIAAIINEAFLAAGESVADENDIDTAMKLGTNYPYGPFEWARKIGYKNLVDSLGCNKSENQHRIVSILLKEKALAQ